MQLRQNRHAILVQESSPKDFCFDAFSTVWSRGPGSLYRSAKSCVSLAQPPEAAEATCLVHVHVLSACLQSCGIDRAVGQLCNESHSLLLNATCLVQLRLCSFIILLTIIGCATCSPMWCPFYPRNQRHRQVLCATPDVRSSSARAMRCNLDMTISYSLHHPRT